MRRPRVTDVEQLKTKVRRLAAGGVLAGEHADICLELGRAGDCRARIAAGYLALSDRPQAIPHDRLLWILDGYLEVHGADGSITDVSQGESIMLAGGAGYRLVFPQLTLYLIVEPEEGH